MRGLEVCDFGYPVPGEHGEHFVLAGEFGLAAELGAVEMPA
jgi:hypothetical protein